MANEVVPIRIGLLYDFPQGGDLFPAALRLGLDEVAATGRLDRDFEFVEQHARGLPSGSEHDIKRSFAKLDDEGVVAIIGPSISDNALIAAPLCDAARIPAINALSEIDGPMIATTPSSSSCAKARLMSCSEPDGSPRACCSTNSNSRSRRPVAATSSSPRRNDATNRSSPCGKS